MTNGSQGQPQNLQQLREMQQQKQSQLESKRQDLRLANMLARVLDPSTPKGFRQLGLRQVAQAVGIDPRGDRTKEMIGAFSSLDPQSLEGIANGIAEDLPQMQPGQLSEMTKGLLSGSIPPEQMLQMVQGATQPQMMKLGGEEAPSEPPPGMMKLGGPIVPEDQKRLYSQAQATPKYEVSQKALPPSGREAPGELAAILGIEAGRYSMSDIRNAGWDRIPDDPEAARKTIEDVTTMQAGVLGSTSMINQVASLIRGRPEVLDLAIRIPWGGGDIAFNPAATVEATKEFFTGMDNWLGKKVKDETNLSDPKLVEAAKKAGENASALFQPGTDMKANEIAEIRGKINSMMVPLAYAMARARHGTGVLSNQDVMAQLDSLGRSQSPDVFLASLKTTSDQLYSQYNQTTKVMTGKEVPIAHLATDDFMSVVQAGGLAPKGMFKETSSAEGGPTRVEVTRDRQKIERKGGEAIEEMERIQTEAFKSEKAFEQEKRQFAREQHQLSKEEAGRAEERLAMARSETIRASFVELGRALRSSPPPSAPGIPQVPGQQAGAFQIAPMQRRQAPKIPERRK